MDSDSEAEDSSLYLVRTVFIEMNTLQYVVPEEDIPCTTTTQTNLLTDFEGPRRTGMTSWGGQSHVENAPLTRDEASAVAYLLAEKTPAHALHSQAPGINNTAAPPTRLQTPTAIAIHR
jgi:hypothetical protein